MDFRNKGRREKKKGGKEGGGIGGKEGVSGGRERGREREGGGGREGEGEGGRNIISYRNIPLDTSHFLPPTHTKFIMCVSGGSGVSGAMIISHPETTNTTKIVTVY